MAKKKTKKKPTSSKRKKENIILRNVLIIIGVIFLAIVVFIVITYFSTHFEYEGVKFKVVQEGELVFYETKLPVIYQGEQEDYNLYLRNDPRKLKDIGFEGEMGFINTMVLNSTTDFNCDGDGMIAIANFVNLYNLLGIEVIKDESAECDPLGNYMFIRLEESNETGIEQYGLACYNININNCEILKSTERFMLETLVKIEELL